MNTYQANFAFKEGTRAMRNETTNSFHYTLRCLDNGNSVTLADINGTQADYERLIEASVIAARRGIWEIVIAPNGLRVYAEDLDFNAEECR